jgi:hypothetical protein
VLVKEPHAHDFEQFYFFFGADPADIKEFKAEVEFSLGEEVEKHIINVPTTVHVPVAMVHGPMNFKKVEKPIIFNRCPAFCPVYHLVVAAGRPPGTVCVWFLSLHLTLYLTPIPLSSLF